MNYGFKCKKQFFLPVVCQLYSVCYSAEALSTVEFFRVGSKNVSNGQVLNRPAIGRNLRGPAEHNASGRLVN